MRSDEHGQSTTGGNSANQGIGQSQSQLSADNSAEVYPDGTEPKSTGTGRTVPKCLPVEAEQPSTDMPQEPSEEQPPVAGSETQNDELQQSLEWASSFIAYDIIRIEILLQYDN